MTDATLTLTNGHIAVGNISNVAADVAMSGDATIDNTGQVIVNNVKCLCDFYTDAGNSHTDGTLDPLYTYTIPANTLANNGDKIQALFAGQIVINTSGSFEVQVTFGGNAIKDTGAFLVKGSEDTNPTSFMVTVDIIRASSTTARTVCRFSNDGTHDVAGFEPNDYSDAQALGAAEYYSLSGLDFTSGIDLVLLGASEGTGAAADDVTAKMGTVMKIKHA